MGHIKEKLDVDLQIQPSKVTEADKKAISEYISKLKSKKPVKKSKNSKISSDVKIF